MSLPDALLWGHGENEMKGGHAATACNAQLQRCGLKQAVRRQHMASSPPVQNPIE